MSASSCREQTHAFFRGGSQCVVRVPARAREMRFRSIGTERIVKMNHWWIAFRAIVIALGAWLVERIRPRGR